MKRRNLLLAVGLPAAVIVVVAILVFATAGMFGPRTALPIPAGSRYYIPLTWWTGGRRAGLLKLRFSATSVISLVGAWSSDAPVLTEVGWENGSSSSIFPTLPQPGPRCGIAYNVTFVPGNYVIFLGSIQPANVTVTQTIQLVPPTGNATPVSSWGAPATVNWTAACP